MLSRSRLMAALLPLTACGSDFVFEPASLNPAEAQSFVRTFTNNEDFNEGKLTGVNHDTSGELRLDVDVFVAETRYLWAPLSTLDQVVRVDTDNGDVLTVDLLHPSEAKPCDNPSRSTVDLRGGVWLGCRGSHGTDGGKKPQCADSPSAQGPDDRVFHVSREGRVDQVLHAGWAPRAVALDAFGHLWVGNSYDGTVWEFDADSGECIRGETTLGVAGRPDQDCEYPALCLREMTDGEPCGSVVRSDWQCKYDGGTYPYGAMVDQEGYLWIKGGSQGLFKIDARHDIDSNPQTIDETEHERHEIVGRYQPSDDTCQSMYGLTVDFNGDVWTGGAHCDDIKHFDGATGDFIGAYKSGGDTLTRGVAVDMDGNIWVANSNKKMANGEWETGSVSQFDPAGKNLQTVFLEYEGKSVQITTGVGVDAYGNIWAMGIGSPVIMQFNPINPDLRRVIEVNGPMYTYSDFLGTALRTVTQRTETANWNTVVDSRSTAPIWQKIAWVAREPAGTSISLDVRCGDTRADLDARTWERVADNPGDIPCDNERYLQVRALFLAQSSAASPLLDELTVRWVGIPRE